MKIPARCFSDDHVREAKFDATPWFEQASDEEVLALARCGWAADYPADAVAQYMAGKNEDVRLMFQYLELVAHMKDAPGFECYVSPHAGELWLQAYRPHLLGGAEWLAERS